MTHLHNTRTAGAALGALALMLAASPAFAGGFYIQEQSAKAAGRAFSGEVADSGADSLWWNPASIGGITGGDASVNVSAILPRGNVANTGTLIVRPAQLPAPVGGDQATSDPINNGVVPSGAIAYGITPQIAVGLALAAPFNFTTEYATTSWTRYSALTSRLRTIDIQPSVAVSPVPGLSLGGAINIERSSATLSNALPNLSPLLPDGSQQLKGSGWDVGYSLGARYEQGPVSLGVSYKSSIRHTLTGTVTIAGLLGPLAGQNAAIPTSASFATPWQLIFGGRFKATSALTLNAQLVRSGWAKFDVITLTIAPTTPIPENYRNTWSYAAGFDADLSPRWTLRGGIQRDISPVNPAARDARVPDTNRWNFALGATHNCSKHLKIDAAFNYLTLDSGPINRNTAAYFGTPVQTPILTNGQVTGAHVVVLSLGARASF